MLYGLYAKSGIHGVFVLACIWTKRQLLSLFSPPSFIRGHSSGVILSLFPHLFPFLPSTCHTMKSEMKVVAAAYEYGVNTKYRFIHPSFLLSSKSSLPRTSTASRTSLGGTVQRGTICCLTTRASTGGHRSQWAGAPGGAPGGAQWGASCSTFRVRSFGTAIWGRIGTRRMWQASHCLCGVHRLRCRCARCYLALR